MRRIEPTDEWYNCGSTPQRRSMMYKFTIPIEPQAKQSFRFTKSGVKYQTKDVKRYKDYIVMFVKTQLPKGFKAFNDAVEIDYKFIYKYRKAQPKYHKDADVVYKVTKPDFDNLLKAINDAIKGLLIEDDAVICKGTFEKTFGPEDKIEIIVRKVDGLFY